MNGDRGKFKERIAILLNGFSQRTNQDRKSIAAVAVRIRTLLEKFGEHHNRVKRFEQAQMAENRDQFQVLLDGYNGKIELDRYQQEKVADDFNLLDVMRLTGKEIRHSMVLAWLLDRDMRKLGTHAQGNLGFRLFIDEFRELFLPIDSPDCKYWVRREVAGDESIVDIEVACRGQFLIHIENKIWATEGADQTNREWSDLQRRAAGLKVPASYIHALFLTPHGTKPRNPNFRAISWGRILRIFDSFAEQAKPPDVKLFTTHYVRAIRKFMIIQAISEDDDAERTVERS